MVRKKVLYQNRGIKPGVKLMMLKQEVIETLLYGCAAWATTAKDIAALNKVHYRLLVQTLGLWRNKKTDVPRSYSSILEEYGCVSMEAMLKFRRLKWAGSVIRMSSSRLPKIMMFGELVDGKKSQGGQPTQWNGVVLQDMIDFGWIKKKEPADKSKTQAEENKVWNDYKAQMWKDEISVTAVLYPKEWEDDLIKGEIHFMHGWHEKETAESKERRKMRVKKHIRLRATVFDGWIPSRNGVERWEKSVLGSKRATSWVRTEKGWRIKVEVTAYGAEGWKKKKVTGWERVGRKWKKKEEEVTDYGASGWELFEENVMKEVRYELRKREREKEKKEEKKKKKKKKKSERTGDD